METEDELYLGAIYDALYSMGYRASDFYIDLKPMAGYEKFIFGPAFTTFGRNVEKNEDYKTLDKRKYAIYDQRNFINKPIVLLETNDNFCAHFGDITSLLYQKMGAVGFITDGNARDIEIIDRYKFPVFCSNINPIDTLSYWALIDCNIPIIVKGISVEPNDLIFASKEGVIRVKRNDEKKFQEKLKNILHKEKNAREFINQIKNFETLPSMLQDYSSNHGRW